MGKKILISGASGFIAGHCILEMLNHGYAVRGTVRDLARTNALRTTLGNKTDRIDALEFVEANLMDPDDWMKAAAGCDGILHVASPVPVIQPKDEDEVIVPARNGTLNVLKAAKARGVPRVVVTSSTAAVFSNDKRGAPFVESDWTDLSRKDLSPYIKSKTIAERAAWEFVTENGGPELAVVNPGLVMGPALESDYGSSLEALVLIMSGAYPLLPRLGFECVDVRDVASLHRLAFETPEAAGHRYLCGNGFRWMSDIANTIKTDFPEFSRIPSREMPDFLVRIAAMFIKEVAQFVPDVGRIKTLDNSPARALGWQPRTIEQAIRDGAQSLLDFGVVKPK